jgi:pimeloyl-ACP methyl ester carboxylesterase
MQAQRSFPSDARAIRSAVAEKVGITSPCPVGVQIAAELIRRTSVRISALPHLHDATRAAVASCLGYDPGERLEVREGDLEVSEIWHLTQLGESGRDDLARTTHDAGVVYRRFEIGPTASGPEAPVPDAFGELLQALDQTLEEVRARSPEYFEQHALRTSLPRDFALLSPSGAAAAVIALAAGPPGCHRVIARSKTVQPDAGHDTIGELIGDAYDIELLFGADPSSLSAVDRLFESRIGSARQSLLAAAAAPGDATPAEPPDAASTAGIEACLSAWSRHHAASHRSERARLAGFPGTDTLHSLSRPDGLQYRVFGDTGPTVIIVNAIGMGLPYWARLVDRLTRDHRIVVWQLRTTTGQGQVATLDDHVGDIAAIVEEVAEGPVHLIGWCSGPKLCLRYAAAHPDRVASMVFLAGTYGDPSSETNYQKRLGTVFELLARSPGMTATVRGMLTDSASVAAGLSEQAGDFAQEPEVLARADPGLQPALIAPYRSDESTLAYAKQIRDFWSCSLDAEARAAASPTLVVSAEFDRIASPKLGLEVAKVLPRARFVEMPGATHYCMYDRPDEVAAMIRDFYASVEPPGGRAAGT